MKKLMYISLLLGFVFLFLSIDITFTGAVIGTRIKIEKNALFIFSLIFFMVSLILFISEKSLESLVIPTGTLKADRKRVETVMRSYARTKDKPYILITGKFKGAIGGGQKKNLNNIQFIKN